MAKAKLDKDELAFCDLYVNGCSPYAGNARKCYEEVFHDNSPTNYGKAKKLLQKDETKEYIEELRFNSTEENIALKSRLKENLLKIVDETSTAIYTDRRGTVLSPAPLRAVSVQAMKTLMDLCPIKEATETKLNIEGAEGGVVFNVIVPEVQKPTE